MIELSLSQARRIALARQFPALQGETQAQRALETVTHLGYVQIDTISVVERAHHHTFWAHDHTYEPSALDQLLAKDRSVFEYWGHAANYLPMTDYRWYIPLMRSFIQHNKWFEFNYSKCKDIMPAVLQRVADEGPLASRDFENPNPRTGQWWDWKPAKLALELLMWTGELMVARRDGFERVYDLTERVLPSHVDATRPSDEDLARWCVHRALRAHVFASEKTIVEHLRICNRSLLRQTIRAMAADGELETVRVKGAKHKYYAPPDTDWTDAPPQPARVLSPFDNVVIERDRSLDLFGFDYKIECYTPAAKRVWGYFTLPVLCGERFVGRIDAKADRKQSALMLRAVHFESDLTPDAEIVAQLAPEIHAFRRFNGCKDWKLEKATRGWKQLLARALKDTADA